jgi:vitamin B12 transporter
VPGERVFPSGDWVREFVPLAYDRVRWLPASEHYVTVIAAISRTSELPVVVVAVALLATSLAHADDTLQPQTIQQLVVTATRSALPITSVGDSITVIDTDAARRSQRTALSDLLTTTAGVSASRNGGLGTTTSVRIRGAESDQTVVLIDGIKLNDPSSPGGGFNFANLLVDDVARVEILRGSQSTLWGSQAIGGVINIVTPDPAGPLSTSFVTQAGSYGTAALGGRAQAGTERFGWRVGANYLHSDGVSAFDEDLGGREDDGYRHVGANVRGVLRFTDAVTAELRSTWSRGRVDIDGSPAPAFTLTDTREFITSREWVSYAGLKVDTLEQRLQHRIGVGYTDTDREGTDPQSSVPRTFDAFGRNLRVDYQGTLALNDRISTVFGIERERSELSTVSPSVFDPTPMPLRRDVTLDSAYAQVQVTAARALTLSGGVRYDDHETFGSDTSMQLAAAWSVSQSTVLRTSYGEGFKAPTLFQLFSQFGNDMLRPEESDDYDIGIEQRAFNDALVVSATYFSRDTDSMIDFVSCFGVDSPQCRARPDGFYENLQQTRADGYELTLQLRPVAPLSFTANYTELDARNASRTSNNFRKRLARRPQHAANAQLSYQWPIPLLTTVAAQYSGRAFDDVANQVVLDDYTLIDLRAEYRLSQRWQLMGRIENVFDQDFATARRFGSIGRGIYLGVRMDL